MNKKLHIVNSKSREILFCHNLFLSCPIMLKLYIFLNDFTIKMDVIIERDFERSEFNILRPKQNCRHFPDDIFKCIFFNENIRISIEMSLKFVPVVPINNIPALVQILAWRQEGDKSLSKPMMVSLLTHLWVTLPQWVDTNLARTSYITTAPRHCL